LPPTAHCVASAKARGSAAAVMVMLVPPSSGPLVGLRAAVEGAAKNAMGVGVYCCAFSETFIGGRTFKVSTGVVSRSKYRRGQ